MLNIRLVSVTALLSLICGASALAQEGASKEEKVAQALRAAPAGLAADAVVKDWDGTVLREGSNGYTCYPGPETMPHSPMCLDAIWQKWAVAWMNKKPFEADGVGIAYMLMGDDGGSNVDPYATEPTDDNEWVVEGPHLMILTPDAAALDSLSDDPGTGAPYVMWKGTPYAHIMVPVR